MLSFISNTYFIIILPNKITNLSANLNYFIEYLYDICIKSKHKKIIRHKEITSIIYNSKRFIQIFRDCKIHFCYYVKHIVTYSLINLNIGYRSYFFKVNTNSLITLNSGYYVLRLIAGKNLNIYKLIVEKIYQYCF